MKNKAFTLIEVVMAVTLMVIILVAVAGMVLLTLFANQRNLHTVQAVGLAQEGLEVMRYMRDSNWLQNYGWDQGATIWGDDATLSLGNEKTLYIEEDVSCPPCFTFSPNEETVTFENGINFTRSLTLQEALDEEGFPIEDMVEVVATVMWRDRTVEKTVELSTYLSNWK